MVDIEVPLEVLLTQQLMLRYGPIIGNEDLCQALGYSSREAFRQALARRDIPIPVFDIEKRRGKYALIGDVAKWLVEQRSRSFNTTTVESKSVISTPNTTIKEVP
ncbi:hypothetical protein GJ699_33865 [Duganella sp. FT80W]|uniref:Pyocin activator protein PrtN n=1 Tax=Duganella guangzhouensis TaxID=2666084 RepID=A0A6I2LDT4_9BURK|nr:hypothetical protein [Duganella guangzhouensis]MRW94946.1 hypothetical protein [Duganella guangzhouensis]